ncbi:MAG: methionyl-tRNA formyltransferase [Acutalibacteraceae bacterium]|nr:methionyl-tRNA formyltransferase [Acutalibacteraceae bacterium]
MRIVFMGTPSIAVGTLEALLKADHEVVGVFTQPDKPVGRKQILTPPPVKVFAEENGISVYQPRTVKDGEALLILKDLNPDIIVVVAYGKILPKEILNLPKYGCVNAHASLLPKYRGASPIQWCIVCGEKQTGVTTMLMDEGMDTGDMLETATVDIGDDETSEELFERLTDTAAELVCSTVAKLEKGEITPKKQNEEDATYAPIITKEMALIDFGRSAADIHNLVRGLYGWPTAYFMLDGKRVKVYKTEVLEVSGEPSTIIKSDNELIIACGNNSAVKIKELQPEGSKRMEAKQWLLGKKIATGTKI